MNNVVVTIISIVNIFLSNFTTTTGSGSGHIDLYINGKNNPPAVVTLADLKPGDNREVPKDLYAKCTSNATIYLHLKEVISSQGVQTEPEQKEEQILGVKYDLPNYIYYDLKLGTKNIITLADKIRFSDAVSCWIPIGEITPNTHVPLYQSFHFDQSVTNWAQGDETKFTEEFIAIDAKSAPPPISTTGLIWDSNLKKCVIGTNPTPTLTPTPSIRPTKTPKPSPTPRPTRVPRNI